MSKSIVVSGPPAIGKTTVAKGLAKEFNLNYLSGGDILKELASEEGLYCGEENALYLWAWYFLSSIAFSGLIMKLTKTQMDLG